MPWRGQSRTLRGGNRMAGQRAAVAMLLIGVLVAAAIGLWWQQRAAAPPAAPATSDVVRIATWNLRKFSERAAPDLVTIAQIIRENRFDLIAIQEVQQQGQAVQRLRRQLNEPWRHAISDPAGTGERFAFVYRGDRMEMLGDGRLVDVAGSEVFARRPYMASFRAGQFDFTAITVHLNWGDVERRRQEAEFIARFAADLAARGREKDIIILGDFNEQASHANAPYFLARGFKPLNREATNLTSTAVYDNILINPTFTGEWLRRVGVVRFDQERYPDNRKAAIDDVSDHRPVWADFSTTGPDDD